MWKFLRIEGSLFVVCLAVCTSWAQVPSDESGTLVMVARTASEVVLSVDSKIDSKGATGTVNTIEGARKLVEVGKIGACAIDGYLGTSEKDVSTYLRAWVKHNPATEVHEGLEGLLESAAATWNDHRYTAGQLPRDRQIGWGITVLTCGDFVNGHPVILRGMTRVAQDGVRAICEKLQPEGSDTLYISGLDFMHPSDFEKFLMGGFSNPSYKDARLYRQARSDLSTDEGVHTVMIEWHNMESLAKDESKTSHPSAYSVWRRASVQALFAPTFCGDRK